MKRKTISRVIALTLASAMCFSACGQTEEKPVTSNESTESKVQESSETEPEVLPYWEMLDKVSDTSELPDWDGEILEINIWSAGGTAEAIGKISDTNVTFKEFERVTGVRINADECYDNGGSNVEAKLPMVIASNDLPTIILGYNIDSTMQELYENGYLADLTKYVEDGTLDQLDKALPFEEAGAFGYNPYRSEDGDYYLLPTRIRNANTLSSIYDTTGYAPEQYDREFHLAYGATPAAVGNKTWSSAIMVRDDILKAVRPDALARAEIEDIYVQNGTFTEEQVYSVNINSLEEFVEFLEDVQEELATGKYKDLNGNTMEVTYGPHTEVDNWPWMYTLFGLTNGMATSSNYFAIGDWTAKDPSQFLVKSFKHETVINYMKALNGLVREDILAKDSMLDNAAVFKEKSLAGHYAVTYQNTDVKNVESDGWAYAPIWLNIPEEKDFGGVTQLVYNRYFGIFKDSLSEEELDQLMHAINYMNSAVGVNNFYWGPESAGLFDVDAEGKRYYTDAELKACVMDNVDNGANVKYGIFGAPTAQQPFMAMFEGILGDIMNPRYLNSDAMAGTADNAITFFNPGIVPGRANADHVMYFNVNMNIYNSLGLSVEGISQFWNARPGFENQLKKVIVAESDAEFVKELEALDQYCIENGFDDKALSEFNDKWVEANEDKLRFYGFIE